MQKYMSRIEKRMSKRRNGNKNSIVYLYKNQ